MDYTVTRNERRLAPDGSGKTEIFICLEMDDGVDYYPFGYWLTEAQVKAVLDDEAGVNDGSAMADAIAHAAKRGERHINKNKMLQATPPNATVN
jgi:hypothetical protein